MVLSKDEVSVLIDYYEAKISYIDQRIDAIVDSNAGAFLDPDILEKQMVNLIDDRDVCENRLKKLKAATNLF